MQCFHLTVEDVSKRALSCPLNSETTCLTICPTFPFNRWLVGKTSQTSHVPNRTLNFPSVLVNDNYLLVVLAKHFELTLDWSPAFSPLRPMGEWITLPLWRAFPLARTAISSHLGYFSGIQGGGGGVSSASSLVYFSFCCQSGPL